MNRNTDLKSIAKFMFRNIVRFRRLLPKKRSNTFGPRSEVDGLRIEHIYVINLDRQSSRWAEMEKELKHLLDGSGEALWHLTERYGAIDAARFTQESENSSDVDSIYTLGEQLFVEPQPLALPTRLQLGAPIKMSRPEIAIARSHIEIWRKVVDSNYGYVLILEDDVWFRSGFAKLLDNAWSEIQNGDQSKKDFDILYLSYQEALHGAPKASISKYLFRPVRGLWHMSGYVISHAGAERLLRLLPCRGPIDLWINHKFSALKVLATKVSIISQRRDVVSTNSYSILPVLTKIGAINSESASLFLGRLNEYPVFAFGPENSGLSSLAMALSMLGYRCCSDLQTLPCVEYDMLLEGRDDRVFNAYVNIGALAEKAYTLRRHFPKAKFIITTRKADTANSYVLKLLDSLSGADITVLDSEAYNKWQVVCELLRCAPPACTFPVLADLGQRQLISRHPELSAISGCKIPKRDNSPWVVESRDSWHGVSLAPVNTKPLCSAASQRVCASAEFLDEKRWLFRDDTFTDNLALFRPSNIATYSEAGVALSVKKEALGVREYSAAAITSCDRHLFGRFEATLKASNVPGIVTGFFLHRNSPRQEIDIEIAGRRTDCLLANVFYNPGDEGAKFDYGYRGAASYIDLGFDASENYHTYAIEWEPYEIRWLVDGRLIHSRVEWEPTPIPHLPMAIHVNAWPSCSKEFAGKLAERRLPAVVYIKSIAIEAHRRQGVFQL